MTNESMLDVITIALAIVAGLIAARIAIRGSSLPRSTPNLTIGPSDTSAITSSISDEVIGSSAAEALRRTVLRRIEKDLYDLAAIESAVAAGVAISIISKDATSAHEKTLGETQEAKHSER